MGQVAPSFNGGFKGGRGHGPRRLANRPSCLLHDNYSDRYGSYQRHSFLICCSVSIYFIAICYASFTYDHPFCVTPKYKNTPGGLCLFVRARLADRRLWFFIITFFNLPRPATATTTATA